jgi:hypothetical protein
MRGATRVRGDDGGVVAGEAGDARDARGVRASARLITGSVGVGRLGNVEVHLSTYGARNGSIKWSSGFPLTRRL